MLPLNPLLSHILRASRSGIVRRIPLIELRRLVRLVRGLPIGGSKHDSKTPIEITSDTLDVLQEKNQAIFSGHVVAIQGDVRLKADKMTITYSKPPEDKNADKIKDAAPKPKAGKDASEKNAIKKIDAEGSVFLTTAEETASGATGTYDVEHQEIFLNNNVVLTRGNNVLKGDKLTYDFKSGKSKITGGASTSPDGKGNGRVRALFVPDSKK